LGIENRKPKIVNFSLSKPATTTQKKKKKKIYLFYFIYLFIFLASAGEGGGRGGGGRECECPRGRPCPHGRWGASLRTPHVHTDAFCGWRFEGRREVSSSTRTGLCPRGRARVHADTSVLSPGNFITDATVRLSHGRPNGHRPTVHPSIIIRVTTLHGGGCCPARVGVRW
jgi:hypothetical protein